MRSERGYNRILVASVYIVCHAALVTLAVIFKELLLNGPMSAECAFYSLFSLYCPGCGGTRSLGALLEFNLIKSFILYPPILITVGFIIYLDVLGIISLARRSYDPIFSFKGRYTVIIPLSIMLFFVIRNVLLFLGIDLVEISNSF